MTKTKTTYALRSKKKPHLYIQCFDRVITDCNFWLGRDLDLHTFSTAKKLKAMATVKMFSSRERDADDYDVEIVEVNMIAVDDPDQDILHKTWDDFLESNLSGNAYTKLKEKIAQRGEDLKTDYAYILHRKGGKAEFDDLMSDSVSWGLLTAVKSENDLMLLKLALQDTKHLRDIWSIKLPTKRIEF